MNHHEEVYHLLNKLKSFILLHTVLFLFAFCDPALCQPKKITVVYGSEEKIALTNWSFVYHLVRKDEVSFKKVSPEVLKKKSQNLYLMERYDDEEGKGNFGKGKEILIECVKLSSIEYLWNWNYGSYQKVILTLTDGTKLERVRLGPIATSFLGEERFLYGKGIYLEGDYTSQYELKHLDYNLDKWLRGSVPKREIIVKIIFQ